MLIRFVFHLFFSLSRNIHFVIKIKFIHFPIVYYPLLYVVLFMYAYLVQVVDVMKDNLDKVLERDAKLTTLENRAGKLKKN